ncbi:Uncharacterised protein [Vibrio cholerae]|nr:Uncharacterised protein [Vibrio cholerae]
MIRETRHKPLATRFIHLIMSTTIWTDFSH